ncbi:nuclease domain-containing protein [Geomonas subterranea]|uniref:nuclease domain-containing protein n=1 Tax=Geomonas subterranea TaxID=2847989 RepID=UPI001CD6C2E6|nr:nuclease domain-containing protein [Geomonas fuzhouensis]
MLQDLEAWLPGITTGAEGGKGGQVGAVGVSAPLIAEALTPLVGCLEKALRAVIEHPRRLDVTTMEDVSLHMVRRVDRETISWAARHPEVSVFLDPWTLIDHKQCEPILPQRLSVDVLDHPANRYISWLVGRVELVLRNTAAGLDAISKAKPMDETAVWCKLRSAKLQTSADQLFKLWRVSFLRDIRKEPLTEAALQVVLDEPEYARVHKIGRLFLNPLFQLQRDEEKPAAAVRPSFSVYELWCFLAVGKQLKELLPTWQWTCKGGNNLIGPSATGEGALHRAVGPAGEILEVRFNPTFASYFARSGKCRWSISGERRPDIIVSYESLEREGVWVCLDAKYRVGRDSLSDAFASAHIYHDSLRYEGFGGCCKSAVLLSPSKSPDTEEWFSNIYLDKYHVGVLELKPGLSCLSAATWLLNQLCSQ